MIQFLTDDRNYIEKMKIVKFNYPIVKTTLRNDINKNIFFTLQIITLR